MFTDKDDEHGTIDLDKCGEEANLYRTKKAVADRRLAAAKKKEDARVKAEADRLAKAKAAAAARRQEEERLARLQKADAEAKATHAAVPVPRHPRAARAPPSCGVMSSL